MKAIKCCIGGLLMIAAFCLLFGGGMALGNFVTASPNDYYSPRPTEAFGLDIPQWIVGLKGIEGTFAYIGAFIILIAVCVGMGVSGYIIIDRATDSDKKDVKIIECPQCRKKIQV